jgi:dihydropyrimidinase
MAMARHDLIIRGGTVATAADIIRCDIAIKNGKIAMLGEDLKDAEDVIDATGKLVLPGGIDSHLHVDEPPFYGVLNADDFESASVSAACGGTTTLIPFVQQESGKSLRASVMDYHKKAEGKAVVDYAFHLMVTDTSDQMLGQELPALIEDGYSSLKIYMTYEGMVLNDYQILQVLDMARRCGAMTMIHAENDHCIHWLTQKLEGTGDTSLAQFPRMAPMAVEREATHRAISLGEIIDVPVLIVHVSAREALDQIKWARDRGLRVYGETCPQYLFLNEEMIAQPGWEGAKYLCAPPPRDRSNPDYLWRGIAGGHFQVVSSDHCSFLFEGDSGKRAHGHSHGPHFRHVAPGVPGVEARMALLYSEGVGKGRIDLNTFVAVTATNAAKIYGLYPRKGTIAVGSDADIAIWDPEKEVTIGRSMLHDRMDYTPYEGFKVKGYPILTLSRGQPVWRDGKPMGKAGRGEFLPCAKPEPARPQMRAAQ